MKKPKYKYQICYVFSIQSWIYHLTSQSIISIPFYVSEDNPFALRTS